jgi:NAD-dependent SIR2 family protein deacetylase
MTLAPPQAGVDEVVAFLAERPLVVLTGAGCSTDSGIPDYRGPGSRYADQDRPLRGSSPPGVMTYQEFVSGDTAQQRYWARSHVGWSRMKRAEPNAGHLALARIDPELLITQNVDGLHERAGTRRMVALHGRIADVVCLDCREVTPRSRLHERLDALNPGFDQDRPDL